MGALLRARGIGSAAAPEGAAGVGGALVEPDGPVPAWGSPFPGLRHGGKGSGFGAVERGRTVLLLQDGEHRGEGDAAHAAIMTAAGSAVERVSPPPGRPAV